MGCMDRAVGFKQNDGNMADAKQAMFTTSPSTRRQKPGIQRRVLSTYERDGLHEVNFPGTLYTSELYAA